MLYVFLFGLHSLTSLGLGYVLGPEKDQKWKNWKKIVKLVKLVVFSRKGYDRKGMKSIVAKYLKNKIIFIKNKPITISSTLLRNQKRLNK